MLANPRSILICIRKPYSNVCFLAVFLGFCVSYNIAIGLNETERQGKALSVFQVVRFPNIACEGSNGVNGTCYTSSECLNRNGANGGSCANGFGVCCTFVIGCGATSSENCTFFKVTGPSPGICNAQICKANPDVCQLRLDFNEFIIAGPNLDAAILNTKTWFSNPSPGGNVANAITRCLTDTFVVTSPGSTSPPVICGKNGGQHMYVDASNVCNNINFNLGSAAVGIVIPTRMWNIKITQISCFDTANLAPSGCTKYFTINTPKQIIQTYNYEGGNQLANQRETFCFRQEKNQCGICFSSDAPADFAVSAKVASGFTSNCCNYGTSGLKTTGFDCLVIPGAITTIAGISMQQPNAVCGNGAGLVTKKGTTNKTICTRQTPFMITFFSDSWTFMSASTKGFKLSYAYKTC